MKKISASMKTLSVVIAVTLAFYATPATTCMTWASATGEIVELAGPEWERGSGGANAQAQLAFMLNGSVTAASAANTQIAAADYHSLAVKSDGSLWAWGYNYYGQLGNGMTESTRFPVLVMPAGSISTNVNSEYTITIPSVVKGSVTASHAAAEAGTTVTVKAIPDDGYQLRAGILTANGNAIVGNSFSIPTPEFVLGDVNGNGRIDTFDSTLILRYLAGLGELAEDQMLAADVNGNGRVDSFDSTLIQRHCAELQEIIQVGYITVEPSSISLDVGDEQNLVARISPENANNKLVKWSSDKPGVVAVDDNGRIAAVSAGNATITATSIGGMKRAICSVKVGGGSSSSITLDIVNGKNYYITVNAEGMRELGEISVTYDSSAIKLVNPAAFQSPGGLIKVGAILGTDIEILNFDNLNGIIAFKCNKKIPNGMEWKGVVTVLEFEAAISGMTELQLTGG